MRNILVIHLLLVFFANDFAKAQPSEKQGNYYTMVWIKYGLKKEGIVSNLSIDIGSDKSHPLYGVVEDSKDGGVFYGKSVTPKVYRSEIDLFSKLTADGWVMKNVSDVNVLGTRYTQYLFEFEK